MLKLKIDYVLTFNYSKSEKLIKFKSLILLCYIDLKLNLKDKKNDQNCNN